MKDDLIYDMLIIGGGPAGYTAAIYAARAGLDAVVLEKLSAGGQMALTEQIDNYPGFEEGIDGFTLAEKMQAQAVRFGVETPNTPKFSIWTLPLNPKKLRPAKAYSTAAQLYWLPAQVPKDWACPARNLLQAVELPTALPATECSIRERLWP